MTVDQDTGEIIPSWKPPFLRTPYNYDMNKASDDHGLECKDATLAQQQFKEECDINTMIERFGQGYQMPENLSIPQQGDFTGVTNFQDAMNVVTHAQTSFMELPAAVRARFGNNPGLFLEFVHDPSNQEEAVKLGLAAAGVTPPAKQETGANPVT